MIQALGERKVLSACFELRCAAKHLWDILVVNHDAQNNKTRDKKMVSVNWHIGIDAGMGQRE